MDNQASFYDYRKAFTLSLNLITIIHFQYSQKGFKFYF